MRKINPLELLAKYKLNECTEEEIALLETWYLNWNKESEPSFTEEELLALEADMFKHVGAKKRNVRSLWPKIAAAACLFIAIGVGSYFLNQPAKDNVDIALAQQDVMPGGNKATLMLADGKIINLENIESGKVATQGGVLIKKNKDGQLIYDLSNANGSSAQTVAYNTIRTPRGGTYQVILPDGTAVWLNSASKIKFPSSFTANDRTVELSGEAYFEVTENPNKPFRVVSAHQVIEVLGTHFNVNTYPDEPVQHTTLVKGSVKVSSGQASRIIKPGEQTQIMTTGTIDVEKVDTELITAWKDGFFRFKKADLKTVMRQLARWYDIDVVYGDKIPAISFSGKIYRNLSLQETLKSIGYLDVKYVLNNRVVNFNTEQN